MTCNESALPETVTAAWCGALCTVDSCFTRHFLYAIGFVANLPVRIPSDSGLRGPSFPRSLSRPATGVCLPQSDGAPAFKRWGHFVRPVERTTLRVFASLALLLSRKGRPMPTHMVGDRSDGAMICRRFVDRLGIVLASTFMITIRTVRPSQCLHACLAANSLSRIQTPMLTRTRHPIYLGCLIAYGQHLHYGRALAVRDRQYGYS